MKLFFSLNENWGSESLECRTRESRAPCLCYTMISRITLRGVDTCDGASSGHVSGPGPDKGVSPSNIEWNFGPEWAELCGRERGPPETAIISLLGCVLFLSGDIIRFHNKNRTLHRSLDTLLELCWTEFKSEIFLKKICLLTAGLQQENLTINGMK